MPKLLTSLKKRSTWSLILVCLLALSAIVNLLTIRSYGASWDEEYVYNYADINFNVIKNFVNGTSFDSLFNYYDMRYYGPAYMIAGNVVIRIISSIIPTINIYQTWHFLNFCLFLLGCWILFILCKRFVSEIPAFFASLLYLTQPLLWGQGIINPKDMPFMVFFLASITLGILAIDKYSESMTFSPRIKPFRPGKIFKGKGLLFILFAIIVGLIFGIFVIDRFTSNALSHSILGWVFNIIQASNTGSFLLPLKITIINGLNRGIQVADYIGKALRLVNSIEFYYIALIALGIAILALLRMSSEYRWMVFAGAILGMTSAIRVIGPVAAGLIILYAILKLHRHAVEFSVVYAIAALVVMYIFWPYLWQDPINRFFETLQVMSNFPWPGSVRFNGIDYSASSLPRIYLPELISIQFTLPVIVFAVIGIPYSTTYLIKAKAKRWINILVLLWFLAPLILVMLFTPNMYDNFRQFLFITPPLFIFSAIAIERFIELLKYKWLGITVCSLLLIPGIAAGVWLHPYEYVYYNALVGWTGNIERKFENDYWGTSLCEAAKYLTQNAKENSQVAFTYQNLTWMFQLCTDKKFHVLIEREEQSKISPDYSVILTRFDDDLDYFRSMQTMMTIHRGKTVFLVIKEK